MTLEDKIRSLLTANADRHINDASYHAGRASEHNEGAVRAAAEAKKHLDAAATGNIDDVAERITGLTFEQFAGWLAEAGVDLDETQKTTISEGITDDISLDDLDALLDTSGVELTEEQTAIVGSSLQEAFPGFGQNRETEAPAQGSSQRPSFTTILQGRGASNGVHSASPLAPGAGAFEAKPPKQGSSEDAESEELRANHQGEDAASKAKKGPGINVRTTTPGTTKGQDIVTVAGDPTKSTGGVIAREHVDTLFASATELSEEFRTKAASLFDAMVTARVAEEKERIENEAAAEVARLVTEHNEAVDAAADQYLQESVGAWIAENEVAIEQSLRTEIFESFVEDIRAAFLKHDIDIPQEKLDLVEAMQTEAEVDKQKIADLEEMAERLADELISLRKKAVLNSVAEGLAATDIERLSTLVEEVAYEDDTSYTEKVQAIKNSFVSAKKAPATGTEITEDHVDAPEGTEPVTDAPDDYVKNIMARIPSKPLVI